MPLLLTILSVLAAWALLGVLILGLLLVYKVLESIRRSLEQIAMGVRAIEQEVAPLEKGADETRRLMVEADQAFAAAADRLHAVQPSLVKAAPALTPR